jgi:predicted site-specific integrase-resolvase
MPEDTSRSGAVIRRTGGAYSLSKAFALLDISPSFGHALVKAGKIQVVRLGPASPRVTDQEISRLLREGLS